MSDLAAPMEWPGSKAANPSLANFMESFLTAPRKFPNSWESSKGYLLMCLGVTADFWLSSSGICSPTNKWGKNQARNARAGSQLPDLILAVFTDVGSGFSIPSQCTPRSGFRQCGAQDPSHFCLCSHCGLVLSLWDLSAFPSCVDEEVLKRTEKKNSILLHKNLGLSININKEKQQEKEQQGENNKTKNYVSKPLEPSALLFFFFPRHISNPPTASQRELC